MCHRGSYEQTGAILVCQIQKKKQASKLRKNANQNTKAKQMLTSTIINKGTEFFLINVTKELK